MNSVNHFKGAGLGRLGNEENCCETGDRYSKANRHLLHGAGDGAGVAGLRLGDVCVSKRVHAGVLQRGKCTVGECLEHDHPDGCAQTDGPEGHDEKADEDRIGNEHSSISDTVEDARHGQLHSHGPDGLRHDEKSGLNGGVSQADLVKQWQEKRHTAHPQAREEAATDGGAKGADSEELELQQWELKTL